MSPEDWLAAAQLDATRRNLPNLVPLLASMRVAIERLRKADWNDDLRDRCSTSPR